VSVKLLSEVRLISIAVRDLLVTLPLHLDKFLIRSTHVLNVFLLYYKNMFLPHCKALRLCATQCSCVCSVYSLTRGRALLQVYCVQYISVVQHQECSCTEYSHLFGCDGGVVLSCVLMHIVNVFLMRPLQFC
jgi:hypothetical protein